MRRKTLLFSLLIPVIILTALVFRGAVHATAYTVTSTQDSGPGSLRWAIDQANANPGADTINFDIPAATDPGCNPGTGVCTIQPTTALPPLTGGLTTVDGYTQSGAAPATAASPATIVIEIDGSSVTDSNGLSITSAGNVIRGLAVNRFPWNGIGIGGSSATGNILSGNYIGLDPSGTLDLGNGYDGVFVGLGAQDNLVGGDEPAERNVLSGNEWDGAGMYAGGTTGNTLAGNYIGLAADGLSAVGNTLSGVHIYGGAQDNTTGGDTAGERNIISGNLLDGVRIAGTGTTANVVAGNYIGIAADGSTARGNGTDGIYIFEGAGFNFIGGDTPGERNVISGNARYGVFFFGGPDFTDNNTVLGNYIGVAASGLAAVPNGEHGIFLYGADWNLIGGDSEGERNVISGNLSSGLLLIISDNNKISGNYIGLDASGLAALPNGENGITFWENSRNNTIGGATLAERNFIAGNEYGIWLQGGGAAAYTTGNLIRNNVIGKTAAFEPLGNTQAGVHFSAEARNNTVGPGNIIAHNGGDGVSVDTPTAFGNAIPENAIYTNGGLGINLTNGANNGIAPPFILSAPGGAGTVTGTACPGCTVEVFANEANDGEGRYYWGSTVAEPVGAWSLAVSSLPFPFLTATATEPGIGTSEFSAVYTAAIPVLHSASLKIVDRETVAPGGLLTYALALTNTGNVAATAVLTDTLVPEVTWADQYSASSGIVTWDSPYNRLLWQGTVAVGGSVLITYQVHVNSDVSPGELISNVAFVDNGANLIITLPAPEVTVIANALYLPVVRR
jgi:uncharacterized repeat protein (TIGR01451 family)